MDIESNWRFKKNGGQKNRSLTLQTLGAFVLISACISAMFVIMFLE